MSNPKTKETDLIGKLLVDGKFILKKLLFTQKISYQKSFKILILQ